MKKVIVILLSIGLLYAPAGLSAKKENGEVRLPLGQYDHLVENAKIPKHDPVPPPVGYTLGQGDVKIEISKTKFKTSALIVVSLNVKIFKDQWVLVPILPNGISVHRATVNNEAMPLITIPEGLAWSSNKIGTYKVKLKYYVDANRSEGGYTISIPVPRASALNFKATLPETGVNVSLIPSAGLKLRKNNNSTVVFATIPTTAGIQLSWRVPHDKIFTKNRALYVGQLKEDSLYLEAEMDVELFYDESISLELLPATVTLKNIEVDGNKASIIVANKQFQTTIKGKGNHKIKIDFQVPIQNKQGSPFVALSIPEIPISAFDLKLPGKKELQVSPATSVTSQYSTDHTRAQFFIPMTNQLTLAWTEAVPEEIKAEVRSHASIYHTVYAEEGVLFVHALSRFEVTRGETNIFEFEIPTRVQINRILSQSGKIIDWRVTKGQKNDSAKVSIFIDRKTKGDFNFDVYYDQSIVAEGLKQEIIVPLIRAFGTDRQRGMVALLSSKELTLKPIREEKVTKVGENQLPAFVRKTVRKTIAHTYKYVEASPKLLVQATVPERKQGKFDAMVNTLISLGDVTMHGSATIDLNVKSGAIEDLILRLPPDVNFLSLSGPSLRTHQVKAEEQHQFIEVQFTQAMEGQFRMEASYERIMSDKAEDVSVPTLNVNGSEVEQGRIAIEALAAVEVQPAVTKQLSSLDPNELPQQLILKTTNPILLAYKYVHVDPPYQLKLKITRHKEVEVQTATIDQATYQTLYTADGLSVTIAKFMVKNSRKQFLRINLPAKSKIWAAFVNKLPEKPALSKASQKDTAEKQILIKIINNSKGFPVTLVYQTPIQKLESFGKIGGKLPRPEMIVTRTKWEVYLPDQFMYHDPETNMRLIRGHIRVNSAMMKKNMQNVSQADMRQKVSEVLQIQVPKTGTLFVFEKLYANQSDEPAMFSSAYTSSEWSKTAQFLLIFAGVVVWLGIGVLFKFRTRGLIVIGAMIVLSGMISIGLVSSNFKVDYTPIIILSVLILVMMIMIRIKERFRNRTANSISEHG